MRLVHLAVIMLAILLVLSTVFMYIYMIKPLKSKVRILEEENSQLRASLNSSVRESLKLKRELAICKAQLANATENIKRLNETLVELENDNARLERLVDKLSSDLEYFRAKYNACQEYAETLESKIIQVRGELASCRAKLEYYNDTVKYLRNVISEIYNFTSMTEALIDPFNYDWSILDYFLNTSIRSVESVDVNFTRLAPRRYVDVFRFVLDNTYYCYDKPIPSIEIYHYNPYISWNMNYVQLPNVTLKYECGDCEDLALLVYALLKRDSLPGEHVYLVSWYTSTIGHMAVLVVRYTPGGKQYYIIDPAGNWLNGAAYYYTTTVYREEPIQYVNATLYLVTRYNIVYISPLDISPQLKKWLVSRKLVTANLYNLTSMEKVDSIKPYDNPYKLLELWLKHHKVGKASIEIHDIRVHKRFTSLGDAAQWLELEG